MLSKILSASLIVGCFAVNAFAWQMREMVTREGVVIRLYYDIVVDENNSNKPSRAVYAQPLDVEVFTPGAIPGYLARVVLINNEHHQGQCGKQSYDLKPTYIIDLQVAPSGWMVGSMKDAKILLNNEEVPLDGRDQRLQLGYRGYCESISTDQELALVLNGNWLKTQDGSSNFKIKLLGN